jgi:hypothetical protein
MTFRDRDGDLHDDPPSWTEARGPHPAGPHGWQADDAGLTCAVCSLPRQHPRHARQEAP